MSTHTDALRDIAANHGWPVCDLAADEIEDLERAYALLFAENAKLRASTTGEAEPVAEDAWPKLDKPAMVGGGSFGKGVTTRFVVEAAQRLYEREAENRSKTPEQRIEDERNRRAAWDLFNGNPFAATPVAPGERSDAEKAWRLHLDQANRENWNCVSFNPKHMNKIAGELDRLRAALSPPAPVAAPAPVPQAIDQLVSALAESKGWMRDYARALIEDAIDRRHLEVAAPAPASEAVAWNIPDQCPHMIVFDDAEASPLTFAGSGARPAALEAFKRKSIQWNAHLFVRIAHNSRDDTYPDATPGDSVDAPAQQAEVAFSNWLDGQEFHELCMDYRGANVSNAREAYEKLQEGIERAALKGEQPAQPSGSERGEV